MPGKIANFPLKSPTNRSLKFTLSYRLYSKLNSERSGLKTWAISSSVRYWKSSVIISKKMLGRVARSSSQETLTSQINRTEWNTSSNQLRYDGLERQRVFIIPSIQQGNKPIKSNHVSDSNYIYHFLYYLFKIHYIFNCVFVRERF